nr:MAG TPA: repressor protein [Caudoviricetes sp.]
MKIYNVIKKLAYSKGISVSFLEKSLRLSNGSVSKWNATVPNAVVLQEVANYFDVTTSFILDEARKDDEKCKN